MFHLTRCCLCVIIFAATSAFAQTDHAPALKEAKSDTGTRMELPHATVRMLNKAFPDYVITVQKKDGSDALPDQTRAGIDRMNLAQRVDRLKTRAARTKTATERSENDTKRKANMVQMVVSVQPLIHQGLTEQDILSALEMISELDAEALVSTRFHRPTGLVFIQTRVRDMGLIDDVMQQLEVSAYTGPDNAFTRNRNRTHRRSSN